MQKQTKPATTPIRPMLCFDCRFYVVGLQSCERLGQLGRPVRGAINAQCSNFERKSK